MFVTHLHPQSWPFALRWRRCRSCRCHSSRCRCCWLLTAGKPSQRCLRSRRPGRRDASQVPPCRCRQPLQASMSVQGSLKLAGNMLARPPSALLEQFLLWSALVGLHRFQVPRSIRQQHSDIADMRVPLRKSTDRTACVFGRAARRGFGPGGVHPRRAAAAAAIGGRGRLPPPAAGNPPPPPGSTPSCVPTAAPARPWPPPSPAAAQDCRTRECPDAHHRAAAPMVQQPVVTLRQS